MYLKLYFIEFPTIIISILSLLLPFARFGLNLNTSFDYAFGYETAIVLLIPLSFAFIFYWFKTKRSEYLIISGVIKLLGTMRLWAWALNMFAAIPELKSAPDIGLIIFLLSNLVEIGTGCVATVVPPIREQRPDAGHRNEIFLLWLVSSVPFTAIYLSVEILYPHIVFIFTAGVDWFIAMTGLLIIISYFMHKSIRSLSAIQLFSLILAGCGVPLYVGLWLRDLGGLLFIDVNFSVMFYGFWLLRVLIQSSIIASWSPLIVLITTKGL